jgi:hypothetical protein
MYDQQSKRAGTAVFQGKMPRKTHANHAQAENLHKWQSQVTKPTVKDIEDDNCINTNPCPPSAHAHQNADALSCQQDEITSDPELLDIIGVLRGTAMIDDEDDISESDSDDGDEESDEIQEITTLEHSAAEFYLLSQISSTSTHNWKSS